MKIPSNYKILTENEIMTKDTLDYSTWRGWESWEPLSLIVVPRLYKKTDFHPSRVFIRKIGIEDFKNPIKKLMFKIGCFNE